MALILSNKSTSQNAKVLKEPQKSSHMLLAAQTQTTSKLCSIWQKM